MKATFSGSVTFVVQDHLRYVPNNNECYDCNEC